jgi:hypothetical protein
MKKLLISLALVGFTGCGDEVARILYCDDVCDKLAKRCLSFVAAESQDRLAERCNRECGFEASAQWLRCIKEHTCGEIFFSAVCFDG